ncbi:MAG: peptide ABC transporter substrate-binding protein, partial [Spirochaetaceae bacterium]|nr:peptide ABC transporter substrate-binding protein [Spirochaetaceae bacterium]
MKKILVLALVVLFAAPALFAAASAETTEGPVEQILTFALQNEPDGLDPGITNNSFASPILLNVFEGLVIYDESNSIVGGSAESWEISDDGLTYTFHLRDNLK